MSYTKPTSGSNNKLVDAAGNATATFPDQTVTNNTPATTFVSNMGQTRSLSTSTASNTLFRAQQFTTGSNADGYSLSAIIVKVSTGSLATPAFALHESTTVSGVDVPGTKVVDLTGSVATAGEQSFTPASATTLSGASTKYFVVLAVSSGNLTTVAVRRARSGNEDSGGSPGWSIADNTLSSADSGSTWTSSNAPMKIAVKGTAVPDTMTAPAFESAAANGASLVITFDEDLAAAASLANSAFTVKKTPSGGSEATVTLSATAPVISGKTVTLTLGTALVSTDTAVKVSYTKPTTGTNNKLVDAAANATATFTDQSVTNNTPATDTTAPAFASAAANGTSLVITFNEDLAAAASLANSAFTVKKTPSGGSEATVTLSATAPVISGKTVTLTLATALVSTDGSVKVSYTKPTSGSNNKLVDAAGNETGTFTDQPVTNNTPAADTTAPSFESAAANGASLVITFDEDLAAAASLANGAFTVKKTPSGGSEATVTLSATAPVISGKTVTLVLGTALVSTDTAVKVTYTKPSTGTANKLVDAAANETATFTDQPVTNNTPALPVITIAAGASGIVSVNPLEGDNAWFTLSRTGSATAALTVNVTVSETGGDRVAAANEGARTVAFGAGQSTVAPNVATVNDRVDQANSTVTMTVTASRATYTVGTPASATVTVQDDDTRGVTVSAATLTVNEGSTGTYTVKLDSQPTASVTVTPSKTGSSDVTFAPASLTFSTSNWNVTQTVTVTAAQDSDAVDDSATISHAVTGGDYGTHSVSAGPVTVTVRDDETGGNNLPTSRSGTVTATEETAFTLSESNFAFSDGDSGDTLASVKITELPAAGEGTLALDGTAITSSALPKTVTKAELDASKLKYTPPADGYGAAYTSFKFKVNDGTADSAAAYTMTINVTNVSDPATGRPTISGTTTVGLTLTASTSGISDPDGLPNTFRYQWKRFAANGTTFEANIGTNSNRYTLTEGDAGKRLKVEVSFTDNGGNREGLLLSAATATVQRPSSGSLSVGGLGAYWHDNHDNGGNLLKVDSCSGVKRFRVIWAGPEGNRRADEWDVEITDRGGARTQSPSFRETPGSPGNFEMIGTVNFTGPGIVTFRVQGRFGSTWGTWSPKASLHCFEI